MKVDNVSNLKEFSRFLKAEASSLCDAEVMLTSASTRDDVVVNVKNSENCSDFVFVDIHYDSVYSKTDLFEDLKDSLKDRDEVVRSEESMLEGSLTFKTREAGRKDGTGRVNRPW
jgi:hypothetical protein